MLLHPGRFSVDGMLLNKITHVNEVEKNIIISSSLDKTIIGYDCRCDKKIFQSTQLFSPIVTFDSFDDYIIGGCDDGSLWMYDWRYPRHCLDRVTQPTKVNQIQCWNRKIVVANESKFTLFK